MKQFISLLLIPVLLGGCAVIEPAAPTLDDPVEITMDLPEPTTLPAPTQAPDPTETEAETIPVPADPIRAQVEQMTPEELVGQLFLARCPDYGAVEDIGRYHLGGYVLFGRDFENQTPLSMKDRIDEYQAAASIPLLIAADEEGGTVTRVSSEPAFRPEAFPSPRSLYETGGTELVLQTEADTAPMLPWRTAVRIKADGVDMLLSIWTWASMNPGNRKEPSSLPVGVTCTMCPFSITISAP